MPGGDDIVPHSIPGVFVKKGTKELFTQRDGFHRPWNPSRSKLAAYILKGANEIPLGPHTNVLYLGAANGTTASHVSDICSKGTVYCIEVSKRSFRDLINTCEAVDNMIPILGDARFPHVYSPLIGQVDVVYQDIAQRDQTNIFVKNLRSFLKPSDEDRPNGIFMVKSRSIDVAANPRNIYKMVLKDVEGHAKVLDSRALDPFEKDHMAIMVAY